MKPPVLEKYDAGTLSERFDGSEASQKQTLGAQPPGMSYRQERLDTAITRLARLEALWQNIDKYNQIIASGRYLKLADATRRAAKAVEKAQQSVIGDW